MKQVDKSRAIDYVLNEVHGIIVGGMSSDTFYYYSILHGGINYIKSSFPVVDDGRITGHVYLLDECYNPHCYHTKILTKEQILQFYEVSFGHEENILVEEW